MSQRARTRRLEIVAMSAQDMFLLFRRCPGVIRRGLKGFEAQRLRDRNARIRDHPIMAPSSLIERVLIDYGSRLGNHPGKWWLHGRLRRGLGVAVDDERTVVRQGLRWSLNPADHAHETLFWLGVKDRWVGHHLLRSVRPGGVVIDAGANFGYFALNLARAVGAEGRVYALEPSPSNFERLHRHVVWNNLEDRVRSFRLGVSDSPATVSMTEPAGNSGHTTVATEGAIRDVPLTTLDAFTAAEGIDRLDLLKIDVEGFEERPDRCAHDAGAFQAHGRRRAVPAGLAASGFVVRGDRAIFERGGLPPVRAASKSVDSSGNASGRRCRYSGLRLPSRSPWSLNVQRRAE